MNFDGKPLRELTETNLRQCIDSGVAEHLYLDYKEQLYDNGHGGRRDFLLDVCMFANAQGGILLIGVPELRDEKGKPTGLPDSAAQLGVEVENAEAVLLSYDGRIASCIEERLAIESHAIAISGGRYVLALRVPDSIRKPHCVRLDGHIYFPSRRERNLYHMGVTEIKDLSMRAASQLERAERLALDTLNQAEHADGPAVIMTIVPIFFRDFLVDIKHDATYKAFEHFTVGGAHRDFTSPTFAVEGLRRKTPGRDAILNRNGVITLIADLSTKIETPELRSFNVDYIDVLLRDFIQQAQMVWSEATIPAPGLLGMRIYTEQKLGGRYHGFIESTVEAGSHSFPVLPIDNVFDSAERIIRPLCDVVHQMFGQRESPRFDADGSWRESTH